MVKYDGARPERSRGSQDHDDMACNKRVQVVECSEGESGVVEPSSVDGSRLIGVQMRNIGKL